MWPSGTLILFVLQDWWAGLQHGVTALMVMKTTWKCKCLCLPLSTTADQGLVSWIQIGHLRLFLMSAVHINKWTPSSVCSSAGLFLDLVNRVTAELWLHNFNEFCCVGVSKYNSGYFYPDYSHLLAFFFGADASADSEVKFHQLVCFAATVHMMDR